MYIAKDIIAYLDIQKGRFITPIKTELFITKDKAVNALTEVLNEKIKDLEDLKKEIKCQNL